MTEGTELVRQETGKMERQNDGAQIETDHPSLMQAIVAASKDKDIDVGKLERLMDMHLKLCCIRSEQEFNAAMRQAQAEMPVIVKDAKNPSTNSNYARLETLKKLASPVISRNGFALQFSQGDGAAGDKIRVACEVSHMGGHSKRFHIDLSPDDVGAKGNPSKTKIHGQGSTFSYGERYLTKLIFNITIAGEDDDGNQGNKPKPQGPSTVAPPEPALKALARELWEVLKPVRGDKKDWVQANQFLWKNDILDGAIPEEAPKLTAARFKEVIAKARGALAQ